MGTRIGEIAGAEMGSTALLMLLLGSVGLGPIKIEKVTDAEAPTTNRKSNPRPAPPFLTCPFDIDESTTESIAVIAEDPSEFIPVLNCIAKHNNVTGMQLRALYLAIDKETFDNPPYMSVTLSNGRIIGVKNSDNNPGDQSWKKLDLVQGDFLVILGKDTRKRAGRIMLVPEGSLRTTGDHSGNLRQLEVIRKKLPFIDTKQFLGDE